MKNLIYLSITITLLLFSCQKDQVILEQEAPIIQTETTDAFYLDRSTVEERYPSVFQEDWIIQQQQNNSRSNCYWNVVAPGTPNALSQAVTDACDYGIIYLEEGVHSQTELLMINKPVKIIGAAGAVLQLSPEAIYPEESGATAMNPAIHVQNTRDFLIQDLTIESTTEAGQAILFENSMRCAIMRNTFTGFQFSGVMEKSDQTVIMYNTITTSSIWQAGETNAHAIINMNGKSCYIADNNISNSTFGVWACDSWGVFENNTTNGNYIGLILCNVPMGIIMPSGELTGSLQPANYWKVRNNTSGNNLNTGYLVIDGASNNILTNNAAENNGAYDIELVGDSERFGFFTPSSSSNSVDASAYPNMNIKDCGHGNSVSGGVMVDNSGDPCN